MSEFSWALQLLPDVHWSVVAARIAVVERESRSGDSSPCTAVLEACEVEWLWLTPAYPMCVLHDFDPETKPTCVQDIKKGAFLTLEELPALFESHGWLIFDRPRDIEQLEQVRNLFRAAAAEHERALDSWWQYFSRLQELVYIAKQERCFDSPGNGGVLSTNSPETHDHLVALLNLQQR